ncbi:hypothetical protein [Aerococcus kribbianus]|uniref:Uncharacterized protein n=1 Tax=Aerococcus kribbianus TaxID=2999064 RepID=A0A9X3FP42_9LACT|nr:MULTISPECIES: hypothetical protein [unclassified Aerococcus]MCZ0717865.1 hypothetical protein [Aerococcus sp. YH-aer221]MCZ0726152.1 hypothetical protein [Aerococcus sp. YH-aer222]
MKDTTKTLALIAVTVAAVKGSERVNKGTLYRNISHYFKKLHEKQNFIETGSKDRRVRM